MSKIIIIILSCFVSISTFDVYDRNGIYNTIKPVTVIATVYQATPAQCNEDYLNTAFGYSIDPDCPLEQRYIAISRDLETTFSKGEIVHIDGAGIYNGKWIIADRMNRRWSNRIDFLVNNDSYIDKFDNVRIIKQ